MALGCAHSLILSIFPLILRSLTLRCCFSYSPCVSLSILPARSPLPPAVYASLGPAHNRSDRQCVERPAFLKALFQATGGGPGGVPCFSLSLSHKLKALTLLGCLAAQYASSVSIRRRPTRTCPLRLAPFLVRSAALCHTTREINKERERTLQFSKHQQQKRKTRKRRQNIGFRSAPVSPNALCARLCQCLCAGERSLCCYLKFSYSPLLKRKPAFDLIYR